jgi:hypothetical protein
MNSHLRSHPGLGGGLVHGGDQGGNNSSVDSIPSVVYNSGMSDKPENRPRKGYNLKIEVYEDEEAAMSIIRELLADTGIVRPLTDEERRRLQNKPLGRRIAP